ncbi:MAG: hypothetical protein ACI9TO_000248 [Rickettsiales bacterium]|jgi:hypothetical protein
MTLQQQVSSLNDNIGNLVLKSEKLTTTIEGKLQEQLIAINAIDGRLQGHSTKIISVEDKLAEYETWKNSIITDKLVILTVGAGKEFAHPVDAANHINNSNLAGDKVWKIQIDPGVYEFPHNGIHEMRFVHYKNVQIHGTSTNAGDTIFKYVGDNHAWLIIGDRHSHLDVRNISFKGDNPITNEFISKIRDRSLRSGMAGAGYAHGILNRYNSTSHIENCNFNNIWHATHCHDHCFMYLLDVTGTNLYGGVYAVSQSHIYVRKSSFTGIGGALTGSSAPWSGATAHHTSSIFCYGVEIRDFHAGVYSHWGSNFHFHKHYDYADDGITQTNIKNGLIENCNYGIHVWHHSGGNVNDTLIKNMEGIAVTVGNTSDIHAHSNVTIDGASNGFYAIHNSSIQANDSAVKNCRNIAYYSSNKSEIHANSTRDKVSGNVTNYSPATHAVLGNYTSYVYQS